MTGELPLGQEANIWVYRYYPVESKQIWHKLKALLFGKGHRLLATAFYGQKPDESFAPIRTTRSGAFMTAPVPIKETVYVHPDSTITLVDTPYPPGFPSSIGYFETDTFNVEEYNYVSLDFISDYEQFDVFLDQSETNPFVLGSRYTTSVPYQTFTVDGNTRYHYTCVVKLIHKYVRVRVERQNGAIVKNAYQFAIKAFMVSQ